MAELSADTSSYPKPVAGQNPLDIAGKLGSLQSQKLDIDQKKLSQANEALTYLTRGLNSLGPNPTKQQLVNMGQNLVNMNLAPPAMVQTMNAQIPDDPAKMPAFVDQLRTQTAEHKDMMDYHLGNIRKDSTGANDVFSQVPGNPRAPIIQRGQLPLQEPPTQETTVSRINPETGEKEYEKRTLGGGRPSPGIVPAGRLGAVPSQQPFAPPSVDQSMPSHPFMQPGEQVKKTEVLPPVVARQGVPLAPPLGESEALVNVAGDSGKQYAVALDRAKNFQNDTYPLAQALPALERLGTKGTGPGTETLNQIKSFALSNIPGVKESDFKGTVKDFDILKKYLTQSARGTGDTGTNDKLAAAFAGNPSVGISNAANVDVVKSALSLRRMQHAIDQDFIAQKLPASQYSKYVAAHTQDMDPRAFGIDMMTPDKIKKIKESFKTQTEADRFEKSLALAQRLNFFTPR